MARYSERDRARRRWAGWRGMGPPRLRPGRYHRRTDYGYEGYRGEAMYGPEYGHRGAGFGYGAGEYGHRRAAPGYGAGEYGYGVYGEDYGYGGEGYGYGAEDLGYAYGGYGYGIERYGPEYGRARGRRGRERWPGRLPRKPARGFPVRGYHTYDLEYGDLAGPTEYSGRAGYAERGWSEPPRGPYTPSLAELGREIRRRRGELGRRWRARGWR